MHEELLLIILFLIFPKLLEILDHPILKLIYFKQKILIVS